MILAKTVPKTGKRAKTPGNPSQERMASNCWVGNKTIIGTAKAPNSAVFAPTVVRAREN